MAYSGSTSSYSDSLRIRFTRINKNVFTAQEVSAQPSVQRVFEFKRWQQIEKKFTNSAKFNICDLMASTNIGESSGWQRKAVLGQSGDSYKWETVVKRWHTVFNFKGEDFAVMPNRPRNAPRNRAYNGIYSDARSIDFFNIVKKFDIIRELFNVTYIYNIGHNMFSGVLMEAENALQEVRKDETHLDYDLMGFIRESEIVPLIPEVILAEIVSTFPQISYQSAYYGYRAAKLLKIPDRYVMLTFADNTARWLNSRYCKDIKIVRYDLNRGGFPLAYFIRYKEEKSDVKRGLTIRSKIYHVLRVLDIALLQISLPREGSHAYDLWDIADNKSKQAVNFRSDKLGNIEAVSKERSTSVVSADERIRMKMSAFVDKAVTIVYNINNKFNKGDKNRIDFGLFFDVDLTNMEFCYNWIVDMADDEEDRVIIVKDMIAYALIQFMSNGSKYASFNFVVLRIITAIILRNKIREKLMKNETRMKLDNKVNSIKQIMEFYRNNQNSFDKAVVNRARDEANAWLMDLIIEMRANEEYDNVFITNKAGLSGDVFEKPEFIKSGEKMIEVHCINKLLEPGIFSKAKYWDEFNGKEFNLNALMETTPPQESGSDSASGIGGKYSGLTEIYLSWQQTQSGGSGGKGSQSQELYSTQQFLIDLAEDTDDDENLE